MVAVDGLDGGLKEGEEMVGVEAVVGEHGMGSQLGVVALRGWKRWRKWEGVVRWGWGWLDKDGGGWMGVGVVGWGWRWFDGGGGSE